MNTPFILGNDFGNQYQLSLVCKEDKSYIVFGDTGRQIHVYNSVGPSLIDEMGQTFRVSSIKPADSIALKLQRKRTPRKFHDSNITPLEIKVTAAEAMVLPPEQVVKVPVDVVFPKKATCLFVECMEHCNRNQEAFFGASSSLIQKEYPFLQIANFTDHPVTIQKGRLLGWVKDPNRCRDSSLNKTDQDIEKLHTHSAVIKTIVNDLLDKANPAQSGQEEEEVEGEAEGAPKTAEVPDPDPIPESELLLQINFSPDLNPEQCKELEQVVLKNKDTFGLNGHLGHYNAEVKIPLHPGAKEVSLPPFPISPEKCAAIDKQIDAWISNGVI